MAGYLAQKRDRYGKLFSLWSRRVGFGRKFAYGLIIAAVIAGSATIATIAGTSSAVTDLSTVLVLLYVDLVLLLMLAVVVGRRIIAIWASRREHGAATRLQIRMAVFFGLVAVTPAIVVAVFSGLFLNLGIQSWFSDRVRNAIHESQGLAAAYLQEHQKNIRADVLAIANDLNRVAPQLRANPTFFHEFLNTQMVLRSLSEAVVVDGNGHTLARAGLSFSLEFELLSRQMLQRALDPMQSGDILVIDEGRDDRVRAGIKLTGFVDAYLFAGRQVAPEVLDKLSLAKNAALQYQRLEERRSRLQVTFVLIFFVVALLVLFAAMWLGLSFANQLANPIGKLIDAAERVRKGDLTARVDGPSSRDELGVLSRTFNRMTDQLNTQRRGLVEANTQLDERRRFTEAVLSGVSAGVIGLDRGGRIHLANRSASELLGQELADKTGDALPAVVPEMADLYEEARKRPDRPAQSEIVLKRDDQVWTLVANIAAERAGGETVGYVVTFDDVSELMAAQRKAAWADVARRIAHEIKNPLTPIQLSAERLKRKYFKQIATDPETFDLCTETIVRQVQEIRRMVDEFSTFARMPQPKFTQENLSELCRQAVFLERNRHPEIRFECDLPAEDVTVTCDRDQISRVLTNILKNAAESIVEREPDGKTPLPPGEICIELKPGDGAVHLTIEDNGKGLPEAHLGRLTEPYVTTREKGTGLGLAIAKRIMDDHEGELTIRNRPEGGASVTLVLPVVQRPGSGSADETGETSPNAIATKIIAHGA